VGNSRKEWEEAGRMEECVENCKGSREGKRKGERKKVGAGKGGERSGERKGKTAKRSRGCTVGRNAVRVARGDMT
jgi:hypothetical protein